jgi:hypothetical protein
MSGCLLGLARTIAEQSPTSKLQAQASLMRAVACNLPQARIHPFKKESLDAAEAAAICIGHVHGLTVVIGSPKAHDGVRYGKRICSAQHEQYAGPGCITANVQHRTCVASVQHLVRLCGSCCCQQCSDTCAFHWAHPAHRLGQSSRH